MFKWFPKVLIDHYDQRMPLNLYKTLFVNGATCAELKPKAFMLLNDIYCKFIQTKSSHTAGSQETQAMKKMVTESCPLMYYSSNGDFELIENTQELIDAFNYFSVERNQHADVRSIERVKGGNDFRLCLFKKASCLFPQSDSIDGRDWTQIKISAPTATISGVAGNSGTVLQTILMGITAIADTNKFAQERKEQRSDLINVRALPDDVQVVYKKVNTHCQQLSKDEIKKFANKLTTDPGMKRCMNTTLCNFRRIPRHSLFTRMGPLLKCSNILILLQNLRTLKSR